MVLQEGLAWKEISEGDVGKGCTRKYIGKYKAIKKIYIGYIEEIYSMYRRHINKILKKHKEEVNWRYKRDT